MPLRTAPVSQPGACCNLVMMLVATLCLQLASEPVVAQQPRERAGKDVFAQTCVKCHRDGVDGAPKVGDEKAWSKLASRGLSSLTASALAGIRKMPPHGANFALTDTEIERAITYMVNQSGGKWTEPISRTQTDPDRSGEQIVAAQCSKCHATGLNGAPRIGDRDAWVPRLKQGFDSLVRSAIRGHGAMPARGGIADITDAELRSAVVFMMNSPPAAKKSQ